jgi:hypothetical protein
VDLTINASWHPVRHEIDPAPDSPEQPSVTGNVPVGDQNRHPPVGLISVLRLPRTTDVFRS